MQHIHSEAPTPRALRGGIPRALETAVLKALAKDPDDRFPGAEEMRRALESATGGARTTTIAALPRQRVERPGEEEPGIGRVLALIAAVVVIALLVAYVAGDERLPLPNGDGVGGAAARPVRIASVQDFDPHGPGASEHPEAVSLATDQDPATAWVTEVYETALSVQKPGVGLLFDLGVDAQPSVVEILLSPAGSDIQLRAGNDIGTSEDSFAIVATRDDAPQRLRLDAADGSGRYWLVWITDLPGGGGGRAGIAEVRFLQ
jgi:hypothetical protein